MNDLRKPTPESDSKTKFQRNRIGRIIFWMGIIFLISNVLVIFVISPIAPNTNFSGINSLAIFGIVLIFIGVLIIYATGTFSKDGLFALQTGPYVK